jgi:hypothetical protein
MSGVTIISTLLEESEALLAAVPISRIKAGRLPDDAPLPALLIRRVSMTEEQMLKRGAVVRTIERISVAVRAGAYRDVAPILKLVRAACAGKLGTIGDFNNVAVLTAGMGPDVIGPGNSFEGTQDFRVSFDSPA